MKNLVKVSMGLMLAIPAASFANADTAVTSSDSKFCAFSVLKNDKKLTEKINISIDPAGLSIEPKDNTVDVNKLLQNYADEHQCSLSSISMGDMAKGLFKGSSSVLSQGANTSSTQSAPQTMGQKYILVAGDVAVCIKRLGLEIPVKNFAPIPVKFCTMQELKADSGLKAQLKFASDPVGLAVESNKQDTDVEKLFKDYAVKHHCTLYSLSMNDLMSGLLKGSTSSNDVLSSQSSKQNKSNKYLLVAGDKAICVKKLGLELPLKAYLPN